MQKSLIFIYFNQGRPGPSGPSGPSGAVRGRPGPSGPYGLLLGPYRAVGSIAGPMAPTLLFTCLYSMCQLVWWLRCVFFDTQTKLVIKFFKNKLRKILKPHRIFRKVWKLEISSFFKRKRVCIGFINPRKG
jgi:hypothetical protein